MSEAITIYDNRSNETRVLKADGYWDDEVGDYMWAEGNYACDCNRALFFARAKGEPDPEIKCGDDRFTVKQILVNGKEVYGE